MKTFADVDVKQLCSWYTREKYYK